MKVLKALWTVIALPFYVVKGTIELLKQLAEYSRRKNG